MLDVSPLQNCFVNLKQLIENAGIAWATDLRRVSRPAHEIMCSVPLQLASDPLFQMIKGTTCNPSSCSRQTKISLVESFNRDAEKKLHMLSKWVRCVRLK